MSGDMTNGHVWSGYKDARSFVPQYPLRVGAKREFDVTGVGVRDASDCWMATFRNAEDAQRYVEEGASRAIAMEAARNLAYDNSPVDTGDDEMTLCRICLKYKSSSGIGQHTKAVHGVKLGQMLKLRVPTEREFRQLRTPNHQPANTGSAA